jgi:hypothetical protein
MEKKATIQSEESDDNNINKQSQGNVDEEQANIEENSGAHKEQLQSLETSLTEENNTNDESTNIFMEKSDNDPIDLFDFDFQPFVTKCPDVFGIDRRSPFWVEANIIGNDVLLMHSLYFCCNEYFQSPRIYELAKHRHDMDDSKNKHASMLNCTFFVTIGTKKAYDKKLTKTSDKNQSRGNNSPLNIHLNNYTTYQDLFRDFFYQKFKNDNAEYLDKCFAENNLITIAVFARSGSKTKVKDFRRYNDQLVGAASFPFDKLDSALLTWLGVIQKSLANLNIHESFAENDLNLQSNYNIGRFLIVMCQVFKSFLQKKWVPVLCQVHQKEREGPLGFYFKKFSNKCQSHINLSTNRSHVDKILLLRMMII